MTEPAASGPPPDAAPVAPVPFGVTRETPAWDRISFTSLTLAVIALAFAAITWAGWFATLSAPPLHILYGWIGIVVALVLGAVWFVMIPVSVLAIVYGLLGIRRARDDTTLRPDMGYAGVALGFAALVVAIVGAAFFAFTWGGGIGGTSQHPFTIQPTP